MHTNHLAGEKSPYLLQHAHNPVDWYPWGEAAFARARDEAKPIFLSIGYSTCHWCHVMERESFESESVAQILNRAFISIKVDREERPDVDRIYMSFVQATTGSGGWPMSVWLTPSLEPFYGGTYFPPDNRYGRPGFATLLEYIEQAWNADRDKIVESGRRIVEQLRQQADVRPAGGRLDASAADSCFQILRRSYDPALGGFGGAPKFPRPVAHNFLLRYHAATGNREAADMVFHTLREMYKGGMYDQVGGGFHRYSVDERWFVPHFEKMLYDQAQLATSYLEAFQITHDPLFARVARDIFEYVLRDMRHPEGAFYSAEDADSAIDAAHPHEKGEGAFYVWTRAELDAALGADAEWFARAFGVEDHGNVTQDPHGEFRGRNILYQAEPAPADAAALDPARARLLGARAAARPRPHLDDKILAGWNGLMISAFALGAQVLGDQRYRTAATDAAAFLLARMRTPEGALLRRFRDGEAAIGAFLDDYAFVAAALVDLYETTLEPGYLEAAVSLATDMAARFEDRQAGGFFSSAEGDASLVLRLKDDYDGAEPAGNSAAVCLLLRLSAMTGREDFRESAARALAAFGERLRTVPHATPQMLVALLLAQQAPQQVVLAGDPGREDFRDLLAAVHVRFHPRRVLLHASPALPQTAAMTPVDGRAAAYVCENFTCQLPVSTRQQLAELLE